MYLAKFNPVLLIFRHSAVGRALELWSRDCWFVWNAKLTETPILSELSIEKESSLIRELFNSIKELFNSIRELFSSFIDLFNSSRELFNSIRELSIYV